MKEILTNIVELFKHLWENAHESIDKDFSNGGVKKLIQNKYVLGMLGIFLICLVIPMFGSSSVNMSFTGDTKESGIPEVVLKRAVMGECMYAVQGEGEISIGKIKVKKVSAEQVDGRAAQRVDWEVKVGGGKDGSKLMTGSTILQQREKGWYKYTPEGNVWNRT
ncbi:MAG: hypothetical protein AB1921_03560 [Thermodesulfobacteriota bacterium]